MKKTYITPEAKAMDFLAENMLALSVKTTSETKGGSDAWSNDKIWGPKSIWVDEQEN